MTVNDYFEIDMLLGGVDAFFTKELLGQIKELHGIQNDIRFSKGVVYNAEKVEIHFLSSVSSVNSYVSSLKKEAGTLFFRGHADPNYILRPSIMRTPRLLQNESEIYHELIIRYRENGKKVVILIDGKKEVA